MNGLYKRVLKGAYPPIDRSYSQSLVKVLQSMLRVEPNLRPSCAQILQMEVVIQKARELGMDIDDSASNEPASRGGNRGELPE